MEANFLKQYLELNKKLIKTLVIKSITSCNLINDYVKLKYGNDAVDVYYPETWKYYMNISGLYHPTDIQEISKINDGRGRMRVISLDTLTEIDFTKETLRDHTSTYSAYQYGTRYYYSLLNKYPDKEQLILGILYPSDINKSIFASEGTILSYPKELIEFQERTLIDELELYIKSYIARWDVKAYAITDSLYPAAQLAIMYLNLIPVLLNMRFKRCKTDEVHSFHIREYLASHGQLDKYQGYFNLKQSMFLYRNIRYIERNSGKVEQFQTLLTKFLSDRKIPATEFSIRHINVFDDKYYPEISIRKKALNLQFNKTETNYIDVDEVYNKELYLTKGNYNYLDEFDTRITRNIKNSNSSVMQSKIIESAMVDYTGSVPDVLEDVLLREWVSLSTKNLYNTVIGFKDPKTFEVRALFAKDAFIYMQYILLTSIGMKVEKIPRYLNIKSRKKTIPNVFELFNLSGNQSDDLKNIAIRINTGQPELRQCNSTTMFSDLAGTIYNEALYHWYLVSNVHDLYDRAYVSSMVESLYEVTNVDLGDMSMVTWLNQQNLPVYDYSYDEAQKLTEDIFISATGLKVDVTASLVNIQKAMIGVMTKLSSYSIQFLSSINIDKIKPLNWAAVRLHISSMSAKTTERINVNSEVFYIHHSATDTVRINSFITDIKDKVKLSGKIKYNILTKNDSVLKYDLKLKYDSYFRGFYIGGNLGSYDTNLSNNTKLIGLEEYLELPEDSKRQLKSIY